MEKTFTLDRNGLRIPCALTEPEHTGVKRCIIGVHGFCGSKDSKILADIAEEMYLFGAATVRFDFPAHGDSPVTDWELSLEKCAVTLKTVAQWARETYPDADMGIFATGFGAFVTLVALEDLEWILDRVKLVLQTPDVQMAASLLNMAKMTAEELHAAGRVVIGKTMKRSVEVPYSFYQDLHSNVVYTPYSMPMLLLHGELDDVVPLEHVANFHRINEQSKLVIIPGADHQFRGQGQWDMVVDLTRDWFEYEQILLCDWE